MDHGTARPLSFLRRLLLESRLVRCFHRVSQHLSKLERKTTVLSTYQGTTRNQGRGELGKRDCALCVCISQLLSPPSGMRDGPSIESNKCPVRESPCRGMVVVQHRQRSPAQMRRKPIPALRETHSPMSTAGSDSESPQETTDDNTC